MRDGWRYLDLKPEEVLSLTHKEFVLISEANVEKTHDGREAQALYAIMNAAASRGKGKKGKLPSVADLYDRKDDPIEAAKSAEEIIEKNEYTRDWLSNFDLSGIVGE